MDVHGLDGKARHPLQRGKNGRLYLFGDLSHGEAVAQHDEQVHHDGVPLHLHAHAARGHLLAAEIVGHIRAEQTAHTLHLQCGAGGDGRDHILGDLDGAERLLVGQIILIFRN